MLFNELPKSLNEIFTCKLMTCKSIIGDARINNRYEFGSLAKTASDTCVKEYLSEYERDFSDNCIFIATDNNAIKSNHLWLMGNLQLPYIDSDLREGILDILKNAHDLDVMSAKSGSLLHYICVILDKGDDFKNVYEHEADVNDFIMDCTEAMHKGFESTIKEFRNNLDTIIEVDNDVYLFFSDIDLNKSFDLVRAVYSKSGFIDNLFHLYRDSNSEGSTKYVSQVDSIEPNY